jgi:hypothetical protein
VVSLLLAYYFICTIYEINLLLYKPQIANCNIFISLHESTLFISQLTYAIEFFFIWNIQKIVSLDPNQCRLKYKCDFSIWIDLVEVYLFLEKLKIPSNYRQIKFLLFITNISSDLIYKQKFFCQIF